MKTYNKDIKFKSDLLEIGKSIYEKNIVKITFESNDNKDLTLGLILEQPIEEIVSTIARYLKDL